MKKIFTVLLIFSLSFGLTSQERQGQRRGQNIPNLTITGKVIETESGMPLEYATISVFNSRDSSLIGGGITDVDGIFNVYARPGTLFAKIEFLSYETINIDTIPIDMEQVRAGNTEIDLGTFQLGISGMMMEEVEIRAEKSETQYMLDKRVFNVGQDIAGRGGTAEDVLDNVPSVTVDIEGTVSLRGNTGVRILIDGRPSSLAGFGDDNGLKSLPANMVDRVEVITNPSARFEAEGSAGIINIVLKKDNRSGFNGSFNGNIGYPERLGAGANINYRKGDINWFLNYSIRHGSYPGGGTLYQEIYADDGNTYITDQNRDSDRGGLNNSFRGGFDYYLNDNENITGSFNYRVGDDENLGTVTYNDYLNNLDNFLGKTIRTDDEIQDESNFEYSLNYRKQYSSREHELKATIQYENETETENSAYDEEFFLNGNIGQNTLNQRSNNKEKQKELLLQVDYALPFSEGHKLEAGMRSSFRNIDNDYLVEEFDDQEWFNLEGLSNHFLYDENINALYATYGNKHGIFSYQLGMRGEWSNVKTELLETNEVNDRDYLNLFPSSFLNFNVKDNFAIQASFSRRLRRPRFRDLNPFFSFSDDRNRFGGNPNLDPEYALSYEVGIIKYFSNATITASLFHRHTDGKIQRIRSLNDDGTTLTQPQNLLTENDYGLELTGNYSGIDWWRIDANANFFQNKTDGTNIGEDFTSDSFTWFGRMTHRITFLDKTDLQLRLNYRGPRDNTQGRSKGAGSVDLGLSRDFMNKNLTLTFNVRDLFQSRRRKYETYDYDDITGDLQYYSEGNYFRRGRSFNLSATYRINQKQERRRRPGNEDADFEGEEVQF